MNDLSVKIILCTYNGEKHIIEQLESIKNQTYRNWHIEIYDDVSEDNTVHLLNKFKKENNNLDIKIIQNDHNQGYYLNFINAILNTHNFSNLICFSDQDDYWLPTKIQRFVEEYKKNTKVPFLYFSRRFITTENLKKLYISPSKYNYPITFPHVFIQNLAGGNTIAICSNFLSLFQKLKYPNIFTIHDWQLLVIATSVEDCKICFDREPTILYRQHGNAAVGELFTLKKLYTDFCKIIFLRKKAEIDQRINFFLKNKEHFSKKQISYIKKIRNYRLKSFIGRLIHIKQINFTFYRFNFFKRALWILFVLLGIF